MQSGGTKDKFQYTGQEKDSETGLNYYNSHIRRFIQADTMLPDVYNPQALNRYSYVNNNPLRYTDPTGHFAFLAALAGALLGPEVALAAVAGIMVSYAIIPSVRNAVNQSLVNISKPVVATVQKAVSTALNNKPAAPPTSTNKPATNPAPFQNNSSKMPNLDPIKKIAPVIPPLAHEVLQQIQDNGGEPLEGYITKPYKNITEPLLPAGDYIEHDIYPLIKGIGRGRERLIIDTITGNAWYTPNHYETKIPMN